MRAEARFCDGCGHSVATPPSTPTTPPPNTALPAALAGGRYQCQRFLGEGAKKRVFLARDTRLERDVALALVKTAGLDEAGLARVQREARAMGRLGDHPHIVTVHDVGDEDGQPYIVSQYLAGGDLDDLLRKSETHRLPLDQTLRIADQVADALAHAHERGILHRDLKPANVWLAKDGSAMLGDFGLAVALDRSRLTLEGMMVGTVAYMPPEQALGRELDARSDLYAFGAMLYELVTGRPPFLGDDAVAIISQHINTPPVAPSWHNADVPRAFEALILRLLAKAPEDRPESAAAVRESLAAITTAANGRAAQAPSEETNPLDRLAGGVFVGRENEMDQLRAGLEDALSGRGRLLLLVGEPGIGKTRMAEELITYARLRRAQVLWGRCYEGDGAPAYWPWVQAIRAYAHDLDAARLLSEMGSGAADIGQVVSEVRDRIPGLPQPPPLEPEQARFRFFDGITTFLRNAAKGTPLVLVLDDLHWADKPSLLLLQFLARELRGARLLVIGSYRDVELGRQHPLAQALGELAREQLAERIVLRGLTERDVGRFIEITAGQKAPATLVAAVHKETEGNPFFVNEVVRLLVSDGRLQHPEAVKTWSLGIPQSVREVVGRRLDRLSSECNCVLGIGAVIGREFGLGTLERVTDLSTSRLVDILEEAVRARVIAEVPRAVGRYSFAHALIRETLYEEHTTTRRIHLHRQIGEVLESTYGANPEPHLAELAYHFFAGVQGGDVQKAIDYAVRAADRAEGLMAHEEAVRHYGLALQAIEFRTSPDEGERCGLLLRLGHTLWRAGSYAEAKETFLRAADVARALAAPHLLAHAALGYGGRLPAFETGVFDQVLVGLLEESLSASQEAQSLLRARLLARLAAALTFSSAEERRRSLAAQAIEMARAGKDPAVLCDVLRAALWATWSADGLEERLVLATECVRCAEAAGDREAEIDGWMYRVSHLLEKGDLAGTDAELEIGARRAEETRQSYFLWGVAGLRTLRLLLQGRLEEAERGAQQTLEIGQGASNPNALLLYGVHMFTLFREHGRLEELAPVLHGLVGQYPLLPIWRCALALLYGEIGREPEARREMEAMAADGFSHLPHDFLWLGGMAFLADACALLGDREHAATLYELMLPYARHHAMVTPIGVCWGSVERSLGRLAATTGSSDAAAAHFEAAIARNDAIGARPWVAHSQQQYAEMLLARGAPGDREKALGLLTRALATAQELKMKVLLDRALALKLRAQGLGAVDWKTSIDVVAAAAQREPVDLRRHAAPDGTVTILFTDIEGSTVMTERLGDRRWLEVLRGHNTVVRQQIARNGDFKVKAQGDGFMVAFQSARRALGCAIALQRAFTGQGPDALRVRIGLHTGEVIREADDFFGKNVILAARIANEARGGEILVSSLLKELTDSSGEVQFGERRDVPLKGLSGTYGIHPVAWAEAGAGSACGLA